MKASPKSDIRPPQIPKHLPAADRGRLADHQELAALSLAGADFTDQQAAGLLFEQVLLRRVIFTRSQLTKIRLVDARAEICELSGAVWEQARFQRVEFAGCRLMGVQWVAAQLEDVLFRECQLEGAVLALTACKAVRFEGCILRSASLEEADLAGVVFRRCDLTNADLRGADLNGADFRGSIIDGMRLTPRDLQGAIIAPEQAIQAATLLGVTVLDDDKQI